jgi:hypothetical protein
MSREFIRISNWRNNEGETNVIFDSNYCFLVSDISTLGGIQGPKSPSFNWPASVELARNLSFKSRFKVLRLFVVQNEKKLKNPKQTEQQYQDAIERGATMEGAHHKILLEEKLHFFWKEKLIKTTEPKPRKYK